MATENETTHVSPSELRIYSRNPRKGNVGAVAASLKAHGQYRPVVANIGSHTGRPNEVLAGNHTVKAFRSLAQREPDNEQWNNILVHWVDVDDDQAARIVLADNRTSQLGGYDNKALSGLLADVSNDLDGLGYTAEDLDMITSLDRGQSDDDPGDYFDDDDEDDEDPDSGGRGNPVIAYAIVFDNDKQKRVWVDFVNWLRRSQPDLTPGERITSYIQDTVL